MAKKEPKENIRCIDCKKAFLMQWDKNPIIAQCRTEGRQVANAVHSCKHFVKADSQGKITHYTRFK